VTKIFRLARGTSYTPAQRRHPYRHTTDTPDMIK